MSLRSDLAGADTINIRKLMVPVVPLMLISPMAYDAWRGERARATSSSSHIINDSLKESGYLGSGYHSSAIALANVLRPAAPGIAPLFNNNQRADELPMNIGNTLDATIDSGFAEIETPSIDIGEPLDPDNPITTPRLLRRILCCYDCVLCRVGCTGKVYDMIYDIWCMVLCVWCLVYGVWCMVYGVWSIVFGL